MTAPSTDTITQGTMRTTSGLPLPLEHTEVDATINGPIATVTVQQRFRNSSGSPIEAEYMFPLPHGASVHTMRFRIGDRTVEAVVKEKEEAKRAYEAARREGRSATLLEQDRPNLFTLSVANIAPGDIIDVTLVYQEKLAFDDGEWRFVFPMVTTERHHAGRPNEVPGRTGRSIATTEVPDAAKIRPPAAATGQRPANVRAAVEIRAGELIEPPRSPSHRIDIENLGQGAYRVKLHESETIPNRDLVIAFRSAQAGIRPRAYFERKADKMGTFLLVVTPPIAPIEDLSLADAGPGGDHRTFRCNNCGGALRNASAIKEWPGIGPAWKCEYCGVVVAATREQAKFGLPRDVVFLVDRSCSMRGASVAQARRAVRMILDHLGPDDRAQVFAFDHDRIAADGRGESFVPVTKEWILQIDEFLRGIQARGGTELEEAFERAARLGTEKGRTRVVVLITDGAVGNEGRLFRRVPTIFGTETRLYILGIGPSVNRYLVERLARAGGGTSDVLLPGEDVETVVPKFARRVRQAGPVLTNVRLSWDDAMPVDVYPSPVPELFGGQTVELYGRFAGSGKSRLVLTGTRATGESFRQEIDVDLPEESNQMPGLERLWARLRIDARMERLIEAPGEAAEVRMEVLALALKHKLLSPYTSLVAEDSEKRVTAPAKKVQMAAVAEIDDEPTQEDIDLELMARTVDDEGAMTTGAPPEPDSDEDLMTSAVYGMPPPMAAAPAPAYYAAPRARAALSVVEDDDVVDCMDGDGGIAMTRAGSIGGYGPPGGSPRGAPPAFGAPPPPMAPPAPAAMAGPPKMIMGTLRVEGAPAARGGFFSKLKEAFGFGEEKTAKAESHAPSGFSEDDDEPPTSRDPEPFEAEGRSAPVGPPVAPAPARPAYHSPGPQAGVSPRPPLESVHTETYSPEMLSFVTRAGAGEIDLVFLVDETGSMGAYIEEVKRRLLEIIEAIRRAPLCRSLRLGLVSYRDHPPQDRSFASRVVPLTDDIASIKKGVERMQASGGGDGPESVTDGLYDIVRLDWRPRAARVVVWVGDAPPHGVEPSGDAFPAGCPCGHHWYAQAENAREMGIVIHAVGCLPALREYRGAEDVFKTVASTSRGLYLPLTQASLLIPIITGVAETELDKQRIEEHIAEVLKTYEKELAVADQEEQVRFVTDVLRQKNVRPRGIVYDSNATGPSPQRFRVITATDVEEGIERLRRTLRTSL
ncbi:MAG: VWA domain-containing protein [Polyangiaceae bacterium]|nr:VWA domain-containing protein [Polyangiaceae bacterium]